MSIPEEQHTGSFETLSQALGARYTLQRVVGRGGTSLVYLAHDNKHDRPVAVKFLRSELTAGLGADRFLREISVASRLQHPHIVPVYDSGDANTVLYLVMPYIDGESLRERIDRERQLPLGEALRLTREIAEALSFAHSRNIVHRDVKPENILLFRGHALVVDFGIAKALSTVGSISITGEAVSVEGLFIGTPLYMAPEQVFSDMPVDERADVYSLATVLYELLEGHPPYEGPTNTAILSRKAARPASAPTQTLEPLPQHIENALLKALERDREHRFASVAEFADALMESKPGQVTVRRSGATTVKSIAVLPFLNATGLESSDYLSDGISEDLIHALSRIPSLRVVGRTSAFFFKGRSDDARAIGAELGVGAVLTGTVRRAGDRLRVTADLTDVNNGFALWSERFDRDVTDVFVVQDEISRAIVETLRIRLLSDTERLVETPTADFGAYESYLKGRFEWSQRTAASMRRGLDHLQHAIDADPTFTLALTGLADCYLTLGIYDVMMPSDAMPKALAAAEAVLRVRPRSAEALTARASVRALYDFDWIGAEADFALALTAREQGPVTHQWYAMHVLAPRMRFNEARAHVARARELDPLSPSIASSAGILRLYERDPEQALRELTLVVSQHPSFGLAHQFQGLAMSELGRHAEAITTLERAVLLSGESLESRSALGYALGRSGDEAGARTMLLALEDESMRSYVSPLLLAQLCVALGEVTRALNYVEDALTVRASGLPFIAVRPSLDPLRRLPRFLRVLSQLGGA